MHAKRDCLFLAEVNNFLWFFFVAFFGVSAEVELIIGTCRKNCLFLVKVSVLYGFLGLPLEVRRLFAYENGLPTLSGSKSSQSK